ncbi:hypothetical protein [Streptococcus ferus]|uniref:hypothetical protein n=1 Tax=Streptococcus ferus TaxID=1345 RepID=UPI0035A08C01
MSGKSRHSTKKASEPIRDLKKETALKNNLFSRYMLLRYSLALLFFANLYWLLIVGFWNMPYMLLPLVLLILVTRSCAEQFLLYGSRQPVLKWSKLAFLSQLVVQIFLLLFLIFSPRITWLFPVFSNGSSARFFLLGIQLLGLLIVLFNLRRIKQISTNTDKFYYRFQTIEKYISL